MEQAAAYSYLLCWEVRRVLAHQATGLKFLEGMVVQEQPAAACHVEKCDRLEANELEASGQRNLINFTQQSTFVDVGKPSASPPLTCLELSRGAKGSRTRSCCWNWLLMCGQPGGRSRFWAFKGEELRALKGLAVGAGAH